jgi:predicted regulator of Ras-like GTPase activity (Roadblock/LC7/MglB family)
VIQGKEGGRLGDDSYEGEVLGGQALYLAMVSRQLADPLRGGEVHSAVLQGTERHLLCFSARRHLVAVLAAATAQVGAVEAAVRKALARGQERKG